MGSKNYNTSSMSHKFNSFLLLFYISSLLIIDFNYYYLASFLHLLRETLLSPFAVEYIGSLAVASFPKYPYDDDDDGDDFINKLTLPHLTPFTQPQRPFRPLPLVWCPQRYYCYCCCCHYYYSLPLGRPMLVPQRLKRKRETIFQCTRMVVFVFENIFLLFENRNPILFPTLSLFNVV